MIAAYALNLMLINLRADPPAPAPAVPVYVHSTTLFDGCNEWDTDAWIPGLTPRPEFHNDGVTPCAYVVP